VRLSDRRGATPRELKQSLGDIVAGMFFSNIIMYFIILATASTLYLAQRSDINSAADAAAALAPVAGKWAGWLFAVGMVAVGFLAVPVMTAGAAYDLCQTIGWKHGLHKHPSHAPAFYGIITVIMLIAMVLNFIGVNPMKALVFAGIVQGLSTPPLMLLIMLITNNRRIMGERMNGRFINVLGWTTTAAIFMAAATLLTTWLL